MVVAGLTVRLATSWSAACDQSGLLELVNQLALGEPYNYRPDEIPAPEDWFPALVDCSDITLVAYNATHQAVGYCVALALTRFPDALAVADELGVPPSTTAYLAELGTCAPMRRRGIASLLLSRALADPPPGTAAWVVRTLGVNAAAITLYRRHGFELVPAVTQIRHGRPRVYLVRRNADFCHPQPGW